MLVAVATAIIFVLLLCLFFEPRWETNDDVGISMVAHGYDIAAIGSPKLIFSNVLWGYLVRAIPEINRVLGYSTASLGVLVTVGAVVIYGLYRFGASNVTCLSALALILVRPVLFPQFTINADLLLVAAIICWHLYAQLNYRRALFAGCILAFFSYLVRSQEFLLVLIVALPLLPWRILWLRRSAQAAFLALISAIAFSMVIDHQAYQGHEWMAFTELNPVRAPFTDYGAGEYLKKRPDIMVQHGYSSNDVDLMRFWFFVDSNIADPKVVRAMLAELGPLQSQGNASANAWIGMKMLWHPNLLPLVLAALLLAVLRPSWQLAASWGLCIAAFLILGILGRPGILRVYVPLVCFLLVAPFLTGHISEWRKRLGASVLLVAAVVNATHVFAESKAFQISGEQTRKGLATFPNSPVVLWSDVFPFESAFPVLGASSSAMSYRLYSLGVFTLAPFSVSFAEQAGGRGMINLLVSPNGIPIIANEILFGHLDVYCRERLHGKLKELSSRRYGEIALSWRRCIVN